jgi:hypothetical protein
VLVEVVMGVYQLLDLLALQTQVVAVAAVGI